MDSLPINIFGREIEIIGITENSFEDILKNVQSFPDDQELQFEEKREGKTYIRGRVKLSYLRDTYKMPIKIK